MRTPTTLVVLALTLSLVGCATPDPAVVPDPESTVAPIFASDEEALAAAEDAYRAYLAESDLVQSRGGDQPDALLAMVSSELRKSFEESFKVFANSDWHTEGHSSFDSVSLQQVVDDSGGSATVVLYLCADVTGVRLFTSEGIDETPVGRDDRIPLEVEISFNDADAFLIERAEYWSGDDFC